MTSTITDTQGKVLDVLLDVPDGEHKTAKQIAHLAGIDGHDRHGRGAVKGSWSGRTSPALAVAPTLTSLSKRGLIERRENDRDRNVYHLPPDGRTLATHRRTST